MRSKVELENRRKRMDRQEKESRITVGELRESLAGYPASTRIMFGSTRFGDPIVFYRVKRRGPAVVQIELNEIQDDDPER